MGKRKGMTVQTRQPACPFDVAVLVTSAGGLDALSAVLRDLPKDLSAAVLIEQHLGGQGSALVEILKNRVDLPIAWIEEGTPIQPGQVLVCPTRKRLEVLPDGTCALFDSARGAREKPLNFLLESLADSYGRRAIAVVLTGMGNDGAAGALALKQAGGIVLVQSEDTAEQPSMPRATVEMGAADLVLPLYDIGPVIGNLLGGGQLPRPKSEVDAAEALFRGLGELPGLLREIDWSQTPLGPVPDWPPAMRSAVRRMLESPMAELILWGPDLVQLYNDHYCALMGDKHPAGLGQMNRVCWPEVWQLNEPIYQRCMAGQPFAVEDQLFPLTRHGYLENAWFSLYYTPIKDEAGATGGILQTCFETTSRVLAERRLRTVHLLSTQAVREASVSNALQQALTILAENNQDLPFALGYLLDTNHIRAQLTGAAGVSAGGPVAPQSIDLMGGNPAWPVAKAVTTGSLVRLDDLATRFRGFRVGPGPEAPKTALLLPLISKEEEAPEGILIVGLSPRLQFDAPYQEFIGLVVAQINANLIAARIRQKEREQLERLRELDRIKTEFFSNVSHEFRTPLTLLLAPLEKARDYREDLPADLAEEIDLAARNAHRLLALVNTLLDFSLIEAGRLHASFAPTDLAALTVDLASLFRGAAERAGLRLRLDCPTLPEPVWVDREMWEKIVSNLLSNALKFTFTGEISVELHALPMHAELVVRDSGVGIPEKELPYLFQRFHRVQGTRARTQEGAGIGLALVNDLVRLHHGRVRVQSQVGEGTTFTVWIPRGERIDRASPLPGDIQVEANGNQEQPAADEVVRNGKGASARQAAALAEIAEHWNRNEAGSVLPEDVLEEPLGHPEAAGLQTRQEGAHVLVVDDSPDMRNYLQRLLAPRWQVKTAANGKQAWEQIRRKPPDLVLADVMMPDLDGFGLLRQIRADEHLQKTPVILLTARAGEEAAIEGLLAGADDYLAKPFSARELVARVGAQLALTKLREESEAAIRESERRFRALAETSPLGVGVSSAEGKIIYTNRAYESILGYGQGGLLGQPSTAVYYNPADQEAWPAALLEKGGVSDYEVKFRRKDGSPVWVSINTAPIEFDGRQAVIGMIQDITERKRVEAVLRESEQRQTLLLKLSDALRPLTDPTEIQAEAARILGQSVGAVWTYYGEYNHSPERMTIYADYRRGDRPSLVGTYPIASFEILDELIQGRAIVVEDTLSSSLFSEGSRKQWGGVGMRSLASVPIVKGGKLIAALVVADTTPRDWSNLIGLIEETAERTWAAVERARTEDILREAQATLERRVEERTADLMKFENQLKAEIEEHKQSEAALRESEARFRALVDTSAQALFRMSPDWKEMRQLQSKNFLADTVQPNRNWLDEYIYPEDQPWVLEVIHKAIQNGSVFDLEHRVLRADGTLGWTASRAVPVRNAAGEIVEWFGAASDITERKQSEEALRKAYSDLKNEIEKHE